MHSSLGYDGLHSRRRFLRRAAHGFGAMALATMLAEDEAAAAPAGAVFDPFLPRKPHFEPRAKSVIFLFMEGGPSHVDLFDPKPELARMNGKPLPARFGKVLTPMGTGGNKPLARQRLVHKYGRAGGDFSPGRPHQGEGGDQFGGL